MNDWLTRIDRWLEMVERALAVAAAVVLLVMIGHMVLDASIRFSGNRSPLETVTVVSGWWMVGVVFLSMPFTARSVGFVRIELLAQFFPPAVRRVTELLSRIICTGYLSLLAWLCAEQAIQRTRQGELWETSNGFLAIWPSRWLLPVALSVLALYYLVGIFRERSRKTGDPAKAEAGL